MRAVVSPGFMKQVVARTLNIGTTSKSGRHIQAKSWIAMALVLLATVWSGCSPSDPQSTFEAAGPIARDQLWLFQVIFWAATVVFIIVEGALVYALFRFRKKSDGGPLPVQSHGKTSLEIAWTIIPILLLVVIMVPTVQTIFKHAEEPDNALQVTVVGHQWWFEFDYTDLGITTANELRIPVDQPVHVKLESDDVIHSFWIPKLAGKTDLVPGNTNTLWFEAEKPGLYYGQCEEFCGTAHAQMRFQVIAEDQAGFDQWVRNQQMGPATPMIPEFGIKGCAVCHTVNGSDKEGTQTARADGFRSGLGQFPAPNLTHFASRGTFAGGMFDRTDENLRTWITDPDSLKSGNRMSELASAYHNPKQALTESDVNALVGYLQSLT